MDNTFYDFLSPFLGEFIGTMMLVLLGIGVFANVELGKTKGNNSGWIVITFGWAIAVFIGVNVAIGWHSFGHINPAVTLGMFVSGKISILTMIVYWVAQFWGAFLGAILVWLAYRPHFNE